MQKDYTVIVCSSSSRRGLDVITQKSFPAPPLVSLSVRDRTWLGTAPLSSRCDSVTQQVPVQWGSCPWRCLQLTITFGASVSASCYQGARPGSAEPLGQRLGPVSTIPGAGSSLRIHFYGLLAQVCCHGKAFAGDSLSSKCDGNQLLPPAALCPPHKH